MSKCNNFRQQLNACTHAGYILEHKLTNLGQIFAQCVVLWGGVIKFFANQEDNALCNVKLWSHMVPMRPEPSKYNGITLAASQGWQVSANSGLNRFKQSWRKQVFAGFYQTRYNNCSIKIMLTV